MIKISELIKFLEETKKEHGDLTVIYELYSDYQEMSLSEVSPSDMPRVEKVIKQGMSYNRIRFHKSAEGKVETELCLVFPGN